MRSVSKYLILQQQQWPKEPIATGLPPEGAGFVPVAFSADVLIGERLAKGGFDYFRRSIVAASEQVAIDVQGDGRGSMAEPAADGDHVHAGGNQLAGVGVAQRVQTYRRQFEFCQQLPPLGRGGVGTSQRAVPPREDKIVIAGTTAPA